MLAIINLGGGEIILILAVLCLLPLGLLSSGFWIWMLVDCVRNEQITGNKKVAWILVIALAHFLGALIYLIFGRNSRGADSMPPRVPV